MIYITESKKKELLKLFLEMFSTQLLSLFLCLQCCVLTEWAR